MAQILTLPNGVRTKIIQTAEPGGRWSAPAATVAPAVIPPKPSVVTAALEEPLPPSTKWVRWSGASAVILSVVFRAGGIFLLWLIGAVAVYEYRIHYGDQA